MESERQTTEPKPDWLKSELERLQTSADTADNANYYRRLEDMRWGYSPEDKET